MAIARTQPRPEPFPESPFLAAFEILLSPRDAFEKMKTQESFTGPLILAGTAGVVSGIVTAIVYVVFATKVMARVAPLVGLPPLSASEVVGGASGIIVTVVASVVGSVFTSFIGVPIIGAIFWVVSRLFGATGSFSAACRIAAYMQAVLLPASLVYVAMIPLAGMPLPAIGWGVLFVFILQTGISFWTVLIVGRGFIVLLDASETGVNVVTWILGALFSILLLVMIPLAFGWQAGMRELQREFDAQRTAARNATPVPAPTFAVRTPAPTPTTDPMVETKRKLAVMPIARLKKPDDLVPSVKKDLLALRVPVREMKLSPASADGGWLISIDLVTTEKSDDAALARNRFFTLAVIGRYIESSGLAARSITVRHVLDDGKVRVEETVAAEIALAAAREL